MGRTVSILAVLLAIVVSGYLIFLSREHVPPTPDPIPPLAEVGARPQQCEIGYSTYRSKENENVTLRMVRPPPRAALSLAPLVAANFQIPTPKGSVVAFELRYGTSFQQDFALLEIRSPARQRYLFPVSSRTGLIDTVKFEQLTPLAMLDFDYRRYDFQSGKSAKDTGIPGEDLFNDFGPRLIVVPGIGSYLRTASGRERPDISVFELQTCDFKR